MGMPIIESSNVTRNQSITDIIESIALTEASLAHILNAQGEILQHTLNMNDTSIDKLLEMCCCVSQSIQAASTLENALHNKLQTLFADQCH